MRIYKIQQELKVLKEVVSVLESNVTYRIVNGNDRDDPQIVGKLLDRGIDSMLIMKGCIE